MSLSERKIKQSSQEQAPIRFLEQIEMSKEECEAKGGVWDPETGICDLRPRLTRKQTPLTAEEAIRHGRTHAYVKGTREQVHLPEPQVPARPVVPVGPITVEQKIDALQAAVTELERQMANVLGLLGVHERKRR